MSTAEIFPRKLVRILETNAQDRKSLTGKGRKSSNTDKNLILECISRVPRIDYRNLSLLLWNQPSHEDIDMLTIAGVVAFADRHISRSINWSRHLALEIPVHNPAKWDQLATKGLLTELLNYLSGDHWEFTFVQRKIEDTRARQSFLPVTRTLPKNAIVMPFSGGLDSFSAFATFREFGEVVYLINTETISANKKNVRALIEATRNSEYSACVPLRIGTRGHAESTYRTRTFLFMVVSALACKLAAGTRLVIPESGQGSLGPCLTRTGNEYPYRGTYPKFIAYVQRWFDTIWPDSYIKIEQPFLWNTKTQMLKKLSKTKYGHMWSKTTSCPRNLKWSKKTADTNAQELPPQCGVCSNCIQRRVALFNAGLNIEKSIEKYAWDDLACDRFEDAHGGRSLRDGVTENDRSLARWGVFSHAHLSDLHANIANDAGYRLVRFDLCQSERLPAQQIELKLCELLKQHHTEWTTFLSSLPVKSWVRQVARG